MALPQSGAHPNAVDMSGLPQVWREILSNSRDWVNAQNLNRPNTVDVTAGGTIALTIDQQYAGSLIRLTGTPGAAFTIQVFDGNADGTALIFENVSGQTATIDTVTGAASPVSVPTATVKSIQTYGIEIVVTGVVGLQVGALLHSGQISPTGVINFADFEIKQALFIDYGFITTSPSSSAGVLTLDIELGNYFDVTLTEAVSTLNLNNPSASGRNCTIILMAKQDGTGGWAITWPASVVWDERRNVGLEKRKDSTPHSAKCRTAIGAWMRRFKKRELRERAARAKRRCVPSDSSSKSNSTDTDVPCVIEIG